MKSSHDIKDVSFIKQSNGTQDDRARIEAETKASISASIAKRTPIEHQIKGLASMPQDIEEQNQLGVELVEWSCNANNYFIEKFPIMRRINPYRFFKAKETNPFFAECVQIAHYICNLHLKEGSITGEVPANLALAYLPIQDGDFRGFIIEKISRKVMQFMAENEKLTCSWMQLIIDHKKERERGDQQLSTEAIPT